MAKPGSNPWNSAAIGAALLVAMSGLTAVLGGGSERAPSPTSTSSTTTAAPAPSEDTGVIPISDEALDRVELALFGGGDPQRSDDDEVVLVTLEGVEVARGPLGGWHTDHPQLGADFEYRGGGIYLTAASFIDDPVPGCGAVHGAGGVLAAVCGPEPETDEIRILTPDRKPRMVVGPLTDPGHWRFALPSPTGRWLLAEWSGECEVTYLVDARDGRRREVVPGGIASNAIGWARDGWAIVGLPAGPCAASSDYPGTYLVDPGTGTRRRIHSYSRGVRFSGSLAHRSNRLEEVVIRAHREIGLEDFGGEPSHGGPSASVSFDFGQHEISLLAVPFDTLRYFTEPHPPGTLTFDCGNARYFLYDHGPEGSLEDPVPDRRLLERAARRLVPGLYCAPAAMHFIDR